MCLDINRWQYVLVKQAMKHWDGVSQLIPRINLPQSPLQARTHPSYAGNAQLEVTLYTIIHCDVVYT